MKQFTTVLITIILSFFLAGCSINQALHFFTNKDLYKKKPPTLQEYKAKKKKEEKKDKSELTKTLRKHIEKDKTI